MNGDPSPWVLVAACISAGWFFKPAAVPAAVTLTAHELPSSPSCDGELRQLLEARDQLEWFRLFALALCAAVCGLLCLLGIVVACACGCCAKCLTRSPPPATTASRRGDPTLLALLAAQEVRR